MFSNFSAQEFVMPVSFADDIVVFISYLHSLFVRKLITTV